MLHSTPANYVRAASQGSEATLASSLVQQLDGRIACRRIDVRTDVANFLTAALPREMCHVVIADRLPQSPLWCDEGIAVLADPLPKQWLHERDLSAGLKNGTVFPLSQVLTREGYPPTDRWGVLHGQSASLVRCLLRGSPRDLLRFVELNRVIGAN